MLNSKSDQSIKYEAGFVLSSNDGKCLPFPAVALYSALFKNACSVLEAVSCYVCLLSFLNQYFMTSGFWPR